MVLHLILLIVLGGVFMNKKKLMKIVASLSLIGGLTGTGKAAFATENVKSTKVEIGQYDEELIEKSVNEMNRLLGNSLALPQLKISNDGELTVTKHWLRNPKVSEEDKKIGVEWELNDNELKTWWVKSSRKLIENYLTINKYNPYSFLTRKTNISWGGKFYNHMIELKEKGLLDKAILQYVETKWEKQLEEFQEQIEKKRSEVEEKKYEKNE